MSKVDLRKDIEKRLKTKMNRKQLRDAKLQELERQLEFAESRCGTLKQQLYYIKLLYGGGEINNMKIPIKEICDGSEQNKCFQGLTWNNNNNSNNNNNNNNNNNLNMGILRNKENGDGIDFSMKTASQTNTTSTNSSKALSFSKAVQEITDEMKQKGHGKMRGHTKFNKSKTKSSKKAKKRRKIDEISPSKCSTVSNQTQSQVWQDPVVEIYKNCVSNAESESGLEIICNNRKIKGREAVKKQRMGAKSSGGNTESESSKEKILEDPRTKSCNALNARKETSSLKEEGIQTELSLDAKEMIRLNAQNEAMNSMNKENMTPTEKSFLLEPVKSYCQPTISSKRKQVERDIYSNLNNINVRNIPFIAAKSTAPSHNIGINIQQVLSIMKKRQPLNDNLINVNEMANQENAPFSHLSSKKVGSKINDLALEPNAIESSVPLEPKKRCEGVRSSLSHWKSITDFNKDKELPLTPSVKEREIEDNQNHDWNFKISKLKRVLIFLHEDFTSLSQKYKRLQKKLTKRNITKTDAKGELADIERDLEKKEEEITVVIGLYKEVLNLKGELKKLQDKYNVMMNGKSLFLDGLKMSSSTHTQMTALLRKIQNFQDQLKA